MKYWLSDIDGVLIDSRELVVESYRRIGVNMPLDAWGHPWKTWLPGAVGSYDLAAKLHAKKTEEYVEVLKSGAVRKNALPFAQIAAALESTSTNTVYYVTGAAEPVALTILSELGLKTSNLLGSGVSTDERLRIMRNIHDSGTYIDDRFEGHRPAQLAGWDFIWAKQDWHWNQ